MASAALLGNTTWGSQERRRTETRRFLVLNALRLGLGFRRIEAFR